MFAAAVAAIICCTWAAASPNAPAHAGPWIYGNSQARFTITEYADLECPYCKDYFPQLKSWIDANPDVNLQWHHLPLSIHEPVAGREARLAECVGGYSGNQAFWEVVELIYRQTRTNGDGLAGQLEMSPANTVVLSDALEHCAIPSKETSLLVQDQAASAAAMGINATPTLVMTDNRSLRSIKLLGAVSGDMLLSATDWLSSQDSRHLR
jgi:protein-disulfide isomerase